MPQALTQQTELMLDFHSVLITTTPHLTCYIVDAVNLNITGENATSSSIKQH